MKENKYFNTSYIETTLIGKYHSIEIIIRLSFQLKDNILAKYELFPLVAPFRQVRIQVCEKTPAVAIIIANWTTFTTAGTCDNSTFPTVGYENFQVLESIVALCAMRANDIGITCHVIVVHCEHA